MWCRQSFNRLSTNCKLDSSTSATCADNCSHIRHLGLRRMLQRGLQHPCVVWFRTFDRQGGHGASLWTSMRRLQLLWCRVLWRMFLRQYHQQRLCVGSRQPVKHYWMQHGLRRRQHLLLRRTEPTQFVREERYPPAHDIATCHELFPCSHYRHRNHNRALNKPNAHRPNGGNRPRWLSIHGLLVRNVEPARPLAAREPHTRRQRLGRGLCRRMLRLHVLWRRVRAGVLLR
jgi:hypothetical protein